MGFLNKHSTTTNLLELMGEITSFVDSSNSVDILTIDFIKASDNISYNKLLYKLQTYSICGKLKLWMKEFLFYKSFKVTLNNKSSKECNVTSSEPQGSKLVSLLCILYANDIAKILKFAKGKVYADDLTVYVAINNTED